MQDTLPQVQSDRQWLDRRLLSATGWTAVSKWLVQAVSWAAMLVLTRLLSPGDFGLLGMTTLFLGLLNLLSECGIDAAIITSRDLTRDRINGINALSVLLGIAAALASAAAAVPMAEFFRTPALRAAMPAMGIAFLFSGFRIVSVSLLSRDLRFRLRGGIEALQALVQAVLAVFLAWIGFGYWALIWSMLAGIAIASVIPAAIVRCGFANPFRREIAADLAFSWRVLVSRLGWFVYSNSDFAIAGRVLGGTALGLYTFAWNIASVPVDKVASLLVSVVPSVLARPSLDDAGRRRYFRLLTEGIALATFPIALGMVLVARPFISTILDPRWQGSIAPLQLLGVAAAIRCASVLVSPALVALRDGRAVMWQSLLGVILLPAALLYTSRWGPAGLASAWLVVQPMLTIPLFWRIHKKLHMPWREIGSSLRAACISCAYLAAAVLAAKYAIAPHVPPLAGLAVQIAAGGAAYAVAVFVQFRDHLAALKNLLRPKTTAAA